MKFVLLIILIFVMKLFIDNLLLVGVKLMMMSSIRGDNHEKSFSFPENFKFGAASAAYQVEGAWNVDGKSPSIWDTFTHNNPELIKDHSNGDVSADSYHFYKKDVAALKQIGFHHYRFSISWPRVLINGTILNPKGIEYYNNLIDALLEENIEPIVTMYHFDLPQTIQDLGGFPNPLLADYFKYYADVLYKHFGDRVKKWITFNEPLNICYFGYGSGVAAPGVVAPGVGDYLCAHTVLLSHASAYQLYKEKYFDKQRGQVGISLNSRYHYAKDETVDDSWIDRVQEFMFGRFANPIFSEHGGYPQVMIDVIGNKSKAEGRPWSRLPVITDQLNKMLVGSSDFLALNYYTSRLISPMVNDSVEVSFENDIGVDYSVDETWTTKGKSEWLYSVPEGLYDLLKWIKVKYNNPEVIISENGFSDDGEIEDDGRVEYLKAHLASVARAIEDGCNVTGYTVWSLLDNFEWMKGYTEKFGIFAVDMKSEKKERVKKKSATFCQKLIADKTFVY